jgi:hypothetical protein
VACQTEAKLLHKQMAQQGWQAQAGMQVSRLRLLQEGQQGGW